MSVKTYQPNKLTVRRTWHLIDAKGEILGRLATKAARILTGKAKITYAPHVDTGDYVVVINATGVKLTGNNKAKQKIDFRHSGYPGGYTITPYDLLLKEKPDRAIELAVSGMLPKTRLRSRQMTRLRVYKGDTHPYGPQFVKVKENAN